MKGPRQEGIGWQDLPRERQRRLVVLIGKLIRQRLAAVRPATGDSFALVMPRVSTEAMQAFLDRFSAALAPDEHAAMAVDGAGWHVAHALRIPDNVTLVLLPPYSPELNPVERVWLFLRERHLSHRLLAGYDAIVDALCTAWNALTPDRLLSLTRYPYLNQVKF